MPYGTKRLVSIPVAGITGLLYGFSTDVSTATSTALGHADASADGVVKPGTVFGANSPKPPRATKQFDSAVKGTESSFIASASIAAAKAAGWKISPGKIRFPSTTKFSVPVMVAYKPYGSTGTVNYAWNMPKYQHALIESALEGLGIEVITGQNYNQAVFGINNPRPGRAKLVVTGEGGTNTLTTFVSTAKEDSLPTGWALASGGSLSFGV